MPANRLFAEGWGLFAVDLIDQPEFSSAKLPSYRQAYKNGGGAIVARALSRGLDEIARLAKDDVAAVAVLHGFARSARRSPSRAVGQIARRRDHSRRNRRAQVLSSRRRPRPNCGAVRRFPL
jgi:hypothetical protein